jgi:hypothetical protein
VEREPNLVISSASQRIVEDGVPFKVDIYKLEGGDGWSLEVVTEDGTSIVWDDLFEDDRVAFEEAISTIRSEGAVAFANGDSNVVPFKHQANGPKLPFTQALDAAAQLPRSGHSSRCAAFCYAR